MNNNAVVVAAAGNGDSSAPVTPASLSGVISVGASDENNQRADWLSECVNANPAQPASNYGSWVDLYAPGTNLIYATISGGYDTQCQAGTSWAAPMVSATASLMLAVNPSLTPAQVTTMIRSTATNTGNTDGHGNSLYLLNTFAAVQQAAILPSQTVTYNYTGTIIVVEAQGFPDPGVFKVGDTVSGSVSYQYPPPLPGVTQGDYIAYNSMIVSMSFYADGIQLLSGAVGFGPPVNAAYIVPGTGLQAQLDFQYHPMGGGPNSLPFTLCSGGALGIDFAGTSMPLGPAFPANLSPQTWDWSIMSGLLDYSNNSIVCVSGWNAVYALVFNINSFTPVP